MDARRVPTGTPDSAERAHRHRDRRSLWAWFALAAFIWLCLGNTASAAAPANDDFANASALTGLPAGATGTNVDATTEAGEPAPWENTPGGHSVWWTWTASADGDVTVDTCGSDFDTKLAVYTGDSVAALTTVAFNDNETFGGCLADPTGGGKSKLHFTAQSGHVYRIAVDGIAYCLDSPCEHIEGTVGSIALAVNESPQPANDDFANAAVLTESVYESAYVSGTNAGASKETGEPSHAGETGGHSVWWSWTAPRSGVVYFGACTSNFDPLLAVYTGVAVDALTEVASNGDSCALSFRASAGVTYHVAVDGAAGSIGDFYLGKSPSPLNDDFESATSLSGLPAEDFRANFGATSEPGEPNHASNAAGHSLWWHWTAPANGPVEVDTCGSFASGYYEFDTVLAVYTGSAVDALNPVASNDDLASCAPGSGVTFIANAGTTYRIAVDAAAGPNPIGWIVLSLRETQTAGPPPSVPPSSNEFSFGKVKKNKTEGSAKLIVEVPGPGTLDLAKTKAVKADHATAEVAGAVTLLVKSRGGALAKLNGAGKAKVNPKVTYTPDGGAPNTKRKKITLVRR